MNEWSLPNDDPDAELRLADSLIGKADALLRRHRGNESSPQAQTDGAYDADAGELPILTDIVVDFDDSIPLLSEPAVKQQADSTPLQLTSTREQDRARMVEHLVQIDTLIAREVEAWLSNELPQLLSRELDALSERLRIETLAHLRATLLPALSTHIASRLDELNE